jgi:hypothetical protein
MFPTNPQIEIAAYHLWERRGCLHGRDREDWQAAEKELAYNLNYEPIRHFGLLEGAPRVLGQRAIRHCRFCERNAKRVRFGPPSPIYPSVSDSSLLTAEICMECQRECRDPLAGDLGRFWESLRSLGAGRERPANPRAIRAFSLGVYKSLVGSALLIMPEPELPYFLDAIEWVSNPDRDVDQRLFAGAACRAYIATEHLAGPSVVLARRSDDEAALPYMIAFLSCGGIIVQIHLPLCSRDEDLDGSAVPLVERSFDWGSGANFSHATCVLLPLASPGDGGRSKGRRNFIECS